MLNLNGRAIAVARGLTLVQDFPLIPLIIVLIGLAIYAIPSVVAFPRKHPDRWIIFAINMASGGTVIGWIGASVWAFNAAHLSNQDGSSHGGESGLNIVINDVMRVRMVGSALGPSSL